MLPTMLSVVPAWGASQNEVIIKRVFDGTRGWEGDADTGDPTSIPTTFPAPHTPGNDSGANNTVVRTWDLFGVRVDWDINEAAASNAILEVTMAVREGGTAEIKWAPDETGMFTGCDASTSSISDDGLTLFCHLGDRPEGSHGVIRPTASLSDGVDSSMIDVDVVMTTNEDTEGVDDQLETPFTVSERPKADWSKNSPVLTATPVTVNNEEGYVVMFPIALTSTDQKSTPVKGAGKLDTSSPISFYDHPWFLADDSQLASDAQIAAANQAGAKIYGPKCGAYVATNGGKYPVTDGEWTCTDAGSPNGYPVTQLSVSNYDNIAPADNVDGSPNSAGYVLTGQLIFWLPIDSVEQDMAPDGASYANTISSNPPGDNLETSEIAPIQLAGNAGPVAETSTTNNTAEFAVYQDTSGGGAIGNATVFNHWGVLSDGFVNYEFLDRGPETYTRRDAVAFDPADWGTMWTGLGEVSRGQAVNMSMFVSTSTSSKSLETPVAGCMRWDPEQIFLRPMDDYKVTRLVGPPPYDSSTFFQQAPTGMLETLDVGTAYSSHFAGGSYQEEEIVAYDATTLEQMGVHIEYGYDEGASTYSDSVGRNAVECNDVTGRVWVDSTDEAGLELRKDAQGRYAFDMVRVRIDSFKWYQAIEIGNHFNGPQADSAFHLSVQGVIGNDLDINHDGKSVYIHTSRAWGEWQDGKPTTTSCQPLVSTDDITLNDPPGPSVYGWCNQAYNTIQENSPGVTWTTLDQSNFTESIPGVLAYDSDSDRVTIVSVKPQVTKTNAAGVFDIKNNGGYVDFDINVAAVGADVEALSNVTLSDPMPSGYVFDSILEGPSSPGATCSFDEPTETLNCRFSEEDPNVDTGDLPAGLPGGWKDTIKIRVQVSGGVASETNYAPITNVATISSAGLGPWDSDADSWLGGVGGGVQDAEQSDTGSASSYMPLGANEAAILKAVEGDPCVYNPLRSVMSDAAWQLRCSSIGLDTDPTNLDETDADGNMTFSLSYENTGNTSLNSVRLVDVLPYQDDDVAEPASDSATDGADPSTVGDARTPGSDFTGELGLIEVTGDVDSYWTTNAEPSEISRDPNAAVRDVVWCDENGDVANADSLATDAIGSCPATGFDVTAVFVNVADILPDSTNSIQVKLDTEGASCDSIWTNSFGARTSDIDLPVRSNDVSIMTQCNYDLALRKVVAPDWGYPSGWVTFGESVVKFDIEVVNQGDPVNDFDVTDYVDTSVWEFVSGDNPAGTTTAGTLGTSGTGVELPYTWDASDPAKPVVKFDGVLPAGQSTIVPVYLTVTSLDAQLDNYAEISYFDSDGDPENGDSLNPMPGYEDLGPITDIDSTPDGNNNEPGDNIMIDDEINLTPSTGDEDDHDIAGVDVFDLALRKTLAKGQSEIIYTGSLVTFDIEVFNQGTTYGTDISLVDYLPDTLQLADKDWTQGEDGKVTIDLEGVSLAPGKSVVVPITVKVLKAGDIDNYAEIATQTPTDENGDVIVGPDGNPVPDIDSIPDTENTDKLIDDEINLRPETGDEDDHDIASIRTLVPPTVPPLPKTDSFVGLGALLLIAGAIFGGTGLVARHRRK